MKLGLPVWELFDVYVLSIFPWEKLSLAMSPEILSTESKKTLPHTDWPDWEMKPTPAARYGMV